MVLLVGDNLDETHQLLNKYPKSLDSAERRNISILHELPGHLKAPREHIFDLLLLGIQIITAVLKLNGAINVRLDKNLTLH